MKTSKGIAGIAGRAYRYMETEDDIRAVFPYDFGLFSLVSIAAEGLAAPVTASRNAAMLVVPANATITLRVMPSARYNEICTLGIRQTGTVVVVSYGAFNGLVGNISNRQDAWINLTNRVQSPGEDVIVVNGGASGGKFYVYRADFRDLESWFVNVLSRWPMKTLLASDGNYDQTMVLFLGPGLRRMSVSIDMAGDGVNNITALVQVLDRFGTFQTISTINRASATPASTTVFLDAKSLGDLNNSGDDLAQFRVRFSTTSSTGSLARSVSISYEGIYDIEYGVVLPFIGTITKNQSALQTVNVRASTGAIFGIVRPSQVVFTAASGGGQFQVLYDGTVVVDETASGTYDLPEYRSVASIDIKVKGDGTNNSTAVYKIRAAGGYFGIRR